MSGRQQPLVLTHRAANIKKKKKRKKTKQKKNQFKILLKLLISQYCTQHGNFPAALAGQLLVKLSSTAVSVQLSYRNRRLPDPHPSRPDLLTHTGLRRLPQDLQRLMCSLSHTITPNIWK